MKAIPLDLRDGLYARGSLHASLSLFHFFFTCPPVYRHAGFLFALQYALVLQLTRYLFLGMLWLWLLSLYPSFPIRCNAV